MPKLIFDFLELKKEELTTKEQSKTQAKHKKPVIHWNSIAVGAGLSFLLVALLDSLHLINYKQLMPFSLIGAIGAGLVVLINQSMRS